MCKKIFVAVFLLATATAVFAVDFGISVGGGALLGGNFTKSETDPSTILMDLGMGPMPAKMALAYETSAFDVGAFVFVDAAYVELSAAYFAEIGEVTGVTATISGTGIADGPQSKDDEDYLSHVIIVDLLGKYPFVLNEQFTVFPALGVGLKFPIAGNDFSDKEHDVTWGVVAKAGAGLDVALTQSLFLRCEALFSYQFISDREATIDGVDYDFKAEGYNLGPQVKIAVGYKVL
jgi:hypothetical protein